ncbi:RiPP maturation radical SAM C-methyltransferase [Actinoplanes utahensis]|uniref:Radical SAM protein n=1 Tax=Actinoplanes utahensis TaxID=1869 RepID=A0A0A6USK4_ACTUT|nr:RiPP maturation radical SAM C-methyltransferase [Actinoplanes utahensis]KHD77968.1 radical SAM protein [Actinoplanes utahensis]GIF29942.1 RiPP maturation radical SAM protein 1 [Actinoplanes utahensis]
MRTVLVAMPFMSADRPSIQLGLLRAIGAGHGFDVGTLHANLDLAARIGADFYRTIADARGPLIGDWLFAVEAFGEQAPDPGAGLLDELGITGPERDRLLRARAEDVPALLTDLAGAPDWADVQVAGFTCTFQQNTASFALARRLKAEHPHLITVFGGAGFDGGMGRELLRRVAAIDLVVSGEADTAFPALLRVLADGGDPATVPGVARRDRAAPPAPPHRDLDALPAPDYHEYFDRAERLGLLPEAGSGEVWLPFESSRGCWWGARHHCTFCGLNATTMSYRSKSPQRVLDELATLAGRHRTLRFEAVDNILDMRYLTSLFPAAADGRHDYELFYEAKANLTREQVRALAHGGVTRLQPGLESLSSHVLALMDKGVRAAQNVNLLRWARYYGIDVAWSILWGFPGETPDDYAEQAAVVPHLAHLQPPEGSGRVWLERFSPLFATARNRTPQRSYRHVYPAGFDLDRLAYFFDHDPADELPDEVYAPLRTALDTWSRDWRRDPRPSLTYRSAPGVLRIDDDRHPDSAGAYTFSGPIAEVYLACVDRPAGLPAIYRRLRPKPPGYVDEVLAEFTARGLIFRDGPLAVALAVPAVPGR